MTASCGEKKKLETVDAFEVELRAAVDKGDGDAMWRLLSPESRKELVSSAAGAQRIARMFEGANDDLRSYGLTGDPNKYTGAEIARAKIRYLGEKARDTLARSKRGEVRQEAEHRIVQMVRDDGLQWEAILVKISGSYYLDWRYMEKQLKGRGGSLVNRILDRLESDK